ncbi:MAG: pyruvate kinase, partial [Idiomarina sp. 34-48-12]
MLRRTKIVTTLGPATDDPTVLEALIKAGANVVRLNFSHGVAEDHERRANQVRDIANRLGIHVAILGDLQGPKIRISKFESGAITLDVGDVFVLDAALDKNAGTQQRVGIDYKELPQDVSEGDILLLDDGRVRLQVEDVSGSQITTTVTVGGKLSNNKGINRLGGGLSAAALTEKDLQDIQTAAKIAVDYLAVSFPRSSADIHEARRLLRAAEGRGLICAKIERAEAVATDA